MARAGATRWTAARALCEGAPATPERVAALMGVEADAVRARSVSERWRCVDWSQPLPGEIIAGDAGEGARQARAVAPPGLAAAACGAGADACDGIGRSCGAAVENQPPDGPAAVAPAPHALAADPGSRLLDRTDQASVLAGASAFVIGQMAALIERAERTGAGLDKKEIDGLSAFAGMIERWEARAREREQEEETTSDEDLARYVRDVNERIVALAALEARRLAAAGFRPQDDAQALSGKLGRSGEA